MINYHRTTEGRVRELENGKAMKAKQKGHKATSRADNHQNRLSSCTAGGTAAQRLVCGRRGERITRPQGRHSCQPQPCNHSLSGLSRRDTHSVWFWPGWEEQAAIHRGGYMGCARLAGRGKEEVPSKAFPTSNRWAGSKPTQQPITLRRREPRAGSHVCAAMAGWGPTRKGWKLHGMASISSSSGTLLLYVSLTGHRTAMAWVTWQTLPLPACKHQNLLFVLPHSPAEGLIHLQRSCLASEVHSTTGSLLQVHPPCPPSSPEAASLLVCFQSPSSHRQTCSLQSQHSWQSVSLWSLHQQHEHSVPSPAGSLGQCSPTSPRGPISLQALTSHSMAGMIHPQHPPLASLLPWGTRSQPSTHSQKPTPLSRKGMEM